MEQRAKEWKRELRAESQVARMVLASAVQDMHRTTPPTQRRLRVVPPLATGDPSWVLLLFPFPDNLKIGRKIDHEHYREVRQEFLNCCLRVVKLKWPDALDIVGFATESGRQTHGSEDAAYLDARAWPEAAQEDARRVQDNFQILVKPNMFKMNIAEYPTSKP